MSSYDINVLKCRFTWKHMHLYQNSNSFRMWCIVSTFALGYAKTSIDDEFFDLKNTFNVLSFLVNLCRNFCTSSEGPKFEKKQKCILPKNFPRYTKYQRKIFFSPSYFLLFFSNIMLYLCNTQAKF